MSDSSAEALALPEQFAVLALGLDVVAVGVRDEVERDLLRARFVALAVIGARAEVVLHGLDHVLGTDQRSAWP